MANNRYLIDTHILLWYLSDDKNLSFELKRVLEDTKNEILVSVVSLWEIFIKEDLGKLTVPKDIEKYTTRSGFDFLDIELEHVLNIKNLKNHHKDPFDRMLIAQAIAENIPIITNDSKFLQYKVKVIGV